MKKWLTMALTSLMMILSVMTPAMAAEIQIDAPTGGIYGVPTTVDPVSVIGGGVTEKSNIDRSKNSAVIAPPFGSDESYLPGSGTLLIPQTQSVIGTVSGSGSGTAAIGSSGTVYYPPAEGIVDGTAEVTTGSASKFTLPDGLFYDDGSLGRLKIPSIGVNVKVYEDESLESLAKGAGHFKSTSCWDGNVGIAGHNRGVAEHFGEIHTLGRGDKITYTTKLGTRTYEVFYVGKIKETDFSRLERSSENMITLITCVRNEPELRWCVQAREII